MSFSELNKCVQSASVASGADVVSVVRCMDEQFINNFWMLFNREHDKYVNSIPKRFDEAKSAAYAKSLPVSLTGCRQGEHLKGTGTQALGAIMKISEGFIPPSSQDLDSIRAHDVVWKMFLRTLSSIPFFADFSEIEKEFYLFSVQKSNEDLYLEDSPGLKVEFSQVSEFMSENLPEKFTERVSTHETLLLDVAKEFPLKPGSKGLKGRRTLMFRAGLWTIITTHSYGKFDGVVIDIRSNLKITETSTSQALIINISSQDVGILMNEQTQSTPLALEKFVEMCGCDEQEVLIFGKWIDGLSCSALKSLFQKLVRFQPKFVEWKNKLLPIRSALCGVVWYLFKNPGSFVPDIQKFTTGVESVLKRCVIILSEDGYYQKTNEGKVSRIMMCAFLAQRVPNYKPEIQVLVDCFDLCLETIQGDNSRLYFKYSTKYPHQSLKISKSTTSKELIALICTEIRSFSTDISMLWSIAVSETSKSLTESGLVVQGKTKRPEVMGLERCVDHHWLPELVYYLPSDLIKQNLKSGSEPFSGVMALLWEKVSSINPRKHDVVNDSDSEIIINTQKKVLHCILKEIPMTIPRCTHKKPHKLTVDLVDGWLAGMVGVVSVPRSGGRPEMIVTLNPRDIRKFVAIRKPSRDMKEEPLDPELEKSAIQYAISKLKEGVLAKNTPNSRFEKSKLFIKDGEWYVMYSGASAVEEWTVAKTYETEFPVIEHIEYSDEIFWNTSNPDFSGCVGNIEHEITKIAKSYSYDIIRCAYTKLSSQKHKIKFPRINRNGGRTKEGVMGEDTSAFEMLKKISVIFPSALRFSGKNLITFHCDDLTAISIISCALRGLLDLKMSGIDRMWTKSIGEKEKRTLKSQQQSALDDMIESHENKAKGNFLWMKMGEGKTFIVLSYLKYLFSKGELPKYILYTYPKEALKSLTKEFEMFGIDWVLLIPNKSLSKEQKTDRRVVQGTRAVEGRITLVEHDHLRKTELTQDAKHSIFIVDEVHKALNDSIRTSVALDISRSSIEFVAMTGTPIIDNHTYKLLWWLEQLCPFSINENTFFVAANAMISKVAPSRVEIERIDKSIDIPKDKLGEYRSLVPRSLGGTNGNPTSSQLQHAIRLCYEICTLEIVELCKYYLKVEKRGCFIVAKEEVHQRYIKDLLVFEKIAAAKDIFMIGVDGTIALTDESVKQKEFPDYKIVITTLSKSLGYSLTRLNVMLKCVYPSNQATREQLDGRLDRIGQVNKITYITVHCGILTNILQHHNSAKSLSTALKDMGLA